MFKTINLSGLIRRSIKQKLKTVTEEAYLKKNANTKPHVINDLNDLIAQSEVYDSKLIERSEQVKNPVPVTNVLGPIEIKHPKIGEKLKWCACGMSLRQPLCDGSHKGTAFKGLTFIIEEPVHSIHLCGCKLTSNAPFCDFATCKGLTKEDELSK